MDIARERGSPPRRMSVPRPAILVEIVMAPGRPVREGWLGKVVEFGGVSSDGLWQLLVDGTYNRFPNTTHTTNKKHRRS